MLLVVDVGNSNTVLGAFSGDALREHWRLETHRDRTADEYRVVVSELFRLSGLSTADVDAAILASVVPPLTPVFHAAVSRTFAVEALHVGPGIRTGMPVRYEHPREVGADRIVNAVAAYERIGDAVVVVDFGTATTFDAVSADGAYLGGAIAPGVGISVDALFRHAAKLPRVELARPATVIGRNTVASIQAGTFFGYVGLVDEIVTRMRAELNAEEPDAVRCIATGGLAELFSTATRTIDDVDPLLTLQGLRILHERNRA